MKQNSNVIAFVIAASVFVSGPAFSESQEAMPMEPAENPELSEGTELLNRGFQLLLEGLAKEVEPMADKWSEGWAQMVERFGEMNAYHPPETLPNGDIIIRRRTPLDPEENPPGETDL